MKRSIPFAPQYRVSKSGEVWFSKTRIYPRSHKSRFNLEHLVVDIDGQREFIWQVLANIWYDGNLPLCRDGGLLRWDEDNVFVLNLDKLSAPAKSFDVEEIQLVWHRYQKEKVWCFNMGEKAGLLGFCTDQYRALITDILIASVK